MTPIRFTVPFSKVETLKDGRMVVEGTATSEAVDSQNDILDYEGSKKAFSDWRGNVREQHDPHKAVGKSLDIKFDDEAKSITVRAFISSGAKDTQAKINEGVIAAYSVGGTAPTRSKTEKVGGKSVRRVLEWGMTELSVVDVGSNPDTNNLELVKAGGAATEILAEETAAAAGAGSGSDEPPEDTSKAKKCDKCQKVHKDGVEACEKEEAAVKTEAEKALEAAELAKKTEERKAAAAILRSKESKPEDLKKAAETLKKSYGGEEYDISAALYILEGLKTLLYFEQSEGDEPTEQTSLLESLCKGIKRFILLEAGELAAGDDDTSDVLVLAMRAEFAKATQLIADRFTEELTKSRPTGDAQRELFTVNHGNQLQEGIGQGVQKLLEPLSKAIGDLKVELDEVKAVREKEGLEKALEDSPRLKAIGELVTKVANQPAVIMPLRHRQGLDSPSPGTALDRNAAAETLLKWAPGASPETKAYLEHCAQLERQK